MTGSLTFTMIKPDAMAAGNMGNIVQAIHDGGFKFKAFKMLHLSKCQAEKFYYIHHERPFYGELCEFMSSGPICAAVLEKENAVEAFRTFIGATNPENAAEGTIRKRFGASIQMNAVHGSDSDDNAVIESSFFFSQLEIV